MAAFEREKKTQNKVKSEIVLEFSWRGRGGGLRSFQQVESRWKAATLFRPTWFDFDGEKAAAAAGATNIQRGFFLRDALTLNQHQERGGPRLNATAIQILLLCVKGASRLLTKDPKINSSLCVGPFQPLISTQALII